MDKPKAALFWSGGKDSALALDIVLKEDKFEVACLVTTLNRELMRVSMHGIRDTLIDEQAMATGVPLLKMWVSIGSNREYEDKLDELFQLLKKEDIEYIIYGDIFLEDIRSYREKILERNSMKGIFPLWKENTSELMYRFITSGFHAVTCCIDASVMNESLLGKEIDQVFINALPEHVDPCGENGEFHSFAYAGPVFKSPIRFRKGEKVFRPVITNPGLDESPIEMKKGFWFLDLLPGC